MKIQGINPAVIAAYTRARVDAGRPSAPAPPDFALDVTSPAGSGPTGGGLSRLVAGTVPSGINRGEGFDQIPPRAFPQQTLQLYGNSAERVEAATRVAVGRILDTTA